MQAASCEEWTQRYHKSQQPPCRWPLPKSPVPRKNKIKKKKNVEPGPAWFLPNLRSRHELFTDRFLKICYAPDTLQGSRLVGGRDCLHRNPLGCSKCPLGACLNLEEGLPDSWTLSGAERGFTKEMMPEPDLLFFSCTRSSWLCVSFL